MANQFAIQKGWALFLDRDGVINQRIPDEYVKQPDDFKFIEGVLEAMADFAAVFNPVVVITNQQGVGRGLMTHAQLSLIHDQMVNRVKENGGRIDAVFYSPDLKNTNSFTRKPAVGLGLKARKQFPEIRFSKSVMVGDTYSDIMFGHRLGMLTVLVGSDRETAFQCAGILDFSFPDLISFAQFIRNNSLVKG